MRYDRACLSMNHKCEKINEIFRNFTRKTEMTFEKTYEVQKDNRLVIKLPKRFRSKKRVRVIIEDVEESRQDKIEILRKASTDPLFLSDIDEIVSDFEAVDNELL